MDLTSCSLYNAAPPAVRSFENESPNFCGERGRLNYCYSNKAKQYQKVTPVVHRGFMICPGCTQKHHGRLTLELDLFNLVMYFNTPLKVVQHPVIAAIQYRIERLNSLIVDIWNILFLPIQNNPV